MSKLTQESPKKPWYWLGFRLLVAALALAWTFSMAPWREVLEAATQITPLAFLGGVVLMLGNMWVGAFRWYALLAAYGAPSPPSVPFLARGYWVGTFYNTLLPANIGGDVVRGHVTQQAFPDSKVAAYVIVVIERFFGLAGLILVALLILSVHPVGQVSVPPAFALLAVLLALGAAISPMVGSAVGQRIGGRLGEALVALPPPARPAWFVVALGLSLVTHSVSSVAGWMLLHDVDPTAQLLDVMVLMPVALISIYLPISVAGLGVREAALVVFLGTVGVSAVDATVCSLGYMGVLLVVALGGGLSHLVAPLTYVTPDQIPDS